MAGLDPFHLVKRTLYCGGPAVELGWWVPREGPPGDLAQFWPQLKDRTVIGTYRGRTAIALACRLLGIGPGHEVLVPAYNCGTELDAILHSGASLVGYAVTRGCEIDFADLSRRRTTRTRAVYLIHYFGWEQPMRELRRWCDEQGLLLIEDCALALFSAGPSGTIGRMGDAAIFSLPKTLGFQHGGLLSLPSTHSPDIPPLALAGFPTLLREIRNSAKVTTLIGLERLGLYGALLSVRRASRSGASRAEDEDGTPDMPDDYYFAPATDADRELHPKAQALAASLNWPEIVRRRRANYLQLASGLAGIKGIEPLFPDLPANVCPLSLPLLVSDRDTAVSLLQARGIAALPWWAGFHQPGIDWPEFSDACWLKLNVLTLPVHQGLDAKHMDYMFKQVSK